MGTNYTATTIASGVASQTSINAEWAAIQAALERMLNIYGDSTNGANAMQSDFDMNSYQILNLPAPTVPSDPLRLADLTASLETASAALTTILDTAGNFTSTNVEGALAELVTFISSGSAVFAVASGTADVMTATLSPVPVLTDGMELRIRALGANTVTTPSLNPNGLGATTITKLGNLALVVGDIPRAGYEMILRYNSANDVLELLNPVLYPILTGEDNVTNHEVEWGDLKRYGAVDDGVTTDDDTAVTNAFANLDVTKKIIISGDHSFSTDVTTSVNDITIEGSGILRAISESGANITFTGDRIKYDADIRGNEQQVANISAKTTTPDVLTVDSGTWTVGDQVINRTTDEFKRVIWAGTISAISGSDLTVTTNTIDGAYADVATSTNLELTKGLDTLHGQVEFNGCDDVSIDAKFFNRDLYIYNCNHVTAGNIRTQYAQVTVIFSRWVEISSINGDEPNFYGLTIQASADVTVGDQIYESPGFSGCTIKGLHDGQFGNLNVHNAPIMGSQIVSYPGSAPDSVNSNLQNDLLNESIQSGNQKFKQCNLGFAIKEIEGLQIGNIFGDRNYKATTHLDASWTDVQIGNFRTKEQNVGQGNTATSSASLWAQNGNGLQIGKMQLDGNEAVSGKWAAYIDNVDDWSIESILCDSIEQFVGINACNDWSVGRFYSTDSVDGTQLLKISGSSRWDIGSVGCDEDANSSIDRAAFIDGVSDDWTISTFKLNFDGVTANPTDGIRNASTGSNNNILNGVANNSTHTFRNTGACDYLTVQNIKAGTGVTNAVSAAAVTDYLIITHCMGTVSDTTGALTNKFVGDNI